MSRTTIGERLVSAAAGAFFGAILGGAVAWMVGVYSSRLGPAETAVNGFHWVAASALAFAVAGLLLGSHAGTLVAEAVAAIFVFESAQDEEHVPRWLVVVVLLVVAVGVWWWFS